MGNHWIIQRDGINLVVFLKESGQIEKAVPWYHQLGIYRLGKDGKVDIDVICTQLHSVANTGKYSTHQFRKRTITVLEKVTL